MQDSNQDNIVVCAICGQKLTLFTLGRHLSKYHKNFSFEQYYDEYIDPENDHLCLCGKKRKFYTLPKGYYKTCGSFKCQRILESKAYFEKTGYTNPLGNPKVRQKIQDNYFEKTGYINPWSNPEVIQKSKDKKLEKYGDENYNNREQCIETCQEKYGVDNVFQADWCKEKSKETMLENWGVEHSMQSLELQEKSKNTRLEKTGYDHNWKDPENRELAKDTKYEKHGDRNYNNSEKIKRTKLENHGDPNYTNREQAKQTYFNKTGYYYSAQNPECKKLQQETLFKNYGVKYPYELSLHQGNVSKISQELCWEVYNKLPKKLQEDTYFDSLNNEWKINTNNKYCLIDFCIPSLRFVLEFYGDYWHKNPEKYSEEERKEAQEKDEIRESIIKSQNFNLYIVWENDYRNNKKDTIENILKEINTLHEQQFI